MVVELKLKHLPTLSTTYGSALSPLPPSLLRLHLIPWGREYQNGIVGDSEEEYVSPRRNLVCPMQHTELGVLAEVAPALHLGRPRRSQQTPDWAQGVPQGPWGVLKVPGMPTVSSQPLGAAGEQMRLALRVQRQSLRF